jgi:hypothetical protein
MLDKIVKFLFSGLCRQPNESAFGAAGERRCDQLNRRA